MIHEMNFMGAPVRFLLPRKSDKHTPVLASRFVRRRLHQRKLALLDLREEMNAYVSQVLYASYSQLLDPLTPSPR